MTLALIDADIVAYRCAASAEKDNEGIAIFRVHDLMNRIIYETGAARYVGYLTGANNFRYEIYPEYKANRKGKPKPQFLEACKEVLVTQWHCKVTDGIEADDALAIDHQAEPDSVLCSIDKDFFQLPGRHFHFVKQEIRTVSPLEGLRNFYTQLIEGDAADNIPAFDGKLRNTRPKFVAKLLEPLNEATTAYDMYFICADLYGTQWDENKELMHRNARLLYLQRKEGDQWNPPTTMDDGQQDDFEASSLAFSEVELDDGPLSTNA
jgi:hypothetical protein